MHTRTHMMLAVIAALGLTASSAFATTDSSQASWSNGGIQEYSSSLGQVAKKGRGGHDDVLPEDPRPEIEVLGAKGRGGHDDVLPEDPRPEIEVLGAKGSGKNGGRTPGGSGCDGADDIADAHPACV